MDKFFWFSLPITLMIIYLFFRAAINKPVSRRDINMIAAIYLMFYFVITAGLGLFWVARMDLPAFDLHYLFGYCLIFLVGVHLWFQLPLVLTWLRNQSPLILLDDTRGQWKPLVKYIFIIVISIVLFSVMTTIVYEFIRPATVPILNTRKETMTANRIWLLNKGVKVAAVDYIHQQGDITHRGVFSPRVNINKPPFYKSYPHYPVIKLPAPSAYLGVSLSSSLFSPMTEPFSVLTLQGLSNLLYYSSGVTDTLFFLGEQLQLRAAASAGALYPNDLYVAVISITGMDPGIYYYHPGNHTLIKVGNQTLLPALAAASPYPDLLEQTSAMIIMSAYFDRAIWKYQERAYRYILPDAGHILGNLSAVSSAMKVPYHMIGLFDDEKLGAILNLSLHDEGVLSIVVLGKKSLSSLNYSYRFIPSDMPNNTNALDMTRLSHRLTSFKLDTRTTSAPVLKSKSGNTASSSNSQLIRLPKGSVANEDVFTTIKHRRSFRQFSTRNVRLEDFAGIIHDAYSPLHHFQLTDEANQVELFVIATQVEHLGNGVYHYVPEANGLEKIAEGDFSNEIYKAGLSQEVLRRAAFVLAWVIDLDKIGSLHGERDYRYANIESGIGGETAYLAATARGLHACAVGAFYDDDLQHLLKIDNTAKRAIFLTAIGQT